MGRLSLHLATIFATAAAIACGGASSEESTTPRSAPLDDPEEPVEVDDGMTVEGITGTLRRDEVDPVMNRAMSRFMRCYAVELDAKPFLVGDIAMHFTVAPDGTVADVRTTSSTLGSRDTEECILDIARGLRFSRPVGGQATFDYGPILFNPGEGIRQPELWDASRVAETLETEESVAALGECSPQGVGVSVTMYVGPGGMVRSIGAVAPSAGADEAARCFERTLSAMTFPDPGMVVAKITMEL